MINTMVGFLKPQSIRSALLSSCVSMIASNLGAKSVATGAVLLGSLMCLPHNQAAKILTEAFVSLMFVPQIQAAHTVQAVPAPSQRISIAKMSQEEMARRLHLHSFVKQYT